MGGADEELNVRVGTSYDGSGLKKAEDAVSVFTKNISSLETDLKAFSSRLKTAVDPTEVARLNDEIKRTKANIDLINKTALNGGQSLKKFQAGSSQAAMALTDLGRVAQDAPFGFIGIQNNLNPLLDSFKRLRQETGSNGSALKALGTSLMGPAGLGLALSLVTGAIVIYQQWQQKANKATKEAKSDVDSYIDTLDQLSQAQLKGAQNAQKEITELQSLYNISQDTTVSTEQRRKAVDDLQKQYPAYFKNLKDETILNGGAKEAYDRLTTAIIATARARAAQDLITKNSSRRLEDEQKIQDELVNYDKQKLAARNALTKLKDPGQAGSARFLAKEAADAEKSQAESAATIRNLKRDISIIDEKNLNLTKSITAEVKKGADLTGKVGGLKTEKAKKQKPVIGQLGVPDDFGILGIVPSEITANPILKIVPVLDLTGVDEAYAELSQTFDAVEEKIQSMTSASSLVSTLAESMSSGFSALGEAIASGDNVIQAFGNAFLSSFAAFLSELGAMVIKKGALMVAIGIAENLVLPGSGAKSIASGITLMAAGAALSVIGGIGGTLASGGGGKKSSPSNRETPRPIPQFANGVTNFAGGLALVGERGPELLNLPMGSSVMPNPETRRYMKQVGGNVVVGGEMKISMRQLVVALRAEEKLMGRTS